MNYGPAEILELFGSLGLFLFGMKVMSDAAKMGPQGIRIAGIISMLSGALLLYILT